MGNSVAGIVAILFMHRLECLPVRSMPIALYKRYIDDICIITTDEAAAMKILELMNQQHPNIEFEIEHPINNGRTLKLLDFEFSITDEGKATFNFYKKRAKKPLFVHCESALPSQTKRNIIRNEVDRIRERCSDSGDLASNLNEFKRILMSNGYPYNVAQQVVPEKPNLKTKRKIRKRIEDPIFLKMPYISDQLNRNINKVLQQNDLPVRMYHKTRTLRDVLRKKEEADECKLKNCPVNDYKLCHVSNCVYQMKCDSCDELYIGSTIRPLHIRVREHINSSGSSVFKHKLTCKSNFQTEILSRERQMTSLRILEAIEIKKRQPSINSRQEREELKDIVF